MEAKLIIKLKFRDADVELTREEAEELYDALRKVLPPREPEWVREYRERSAQISLESQMNVGEQLERDRANYGPVRGLK